MLVIGIVLGALVQLALVALRCSFRIEEGHVGVLTSFGAAARDSQGRLRVWRPGLHFKRPWQAVHRVPLMEQSIDLSGPSGSRAVRLEDGTVLHVGSVLRFRPVEPELRRFLFDLKEPKKHIAELFTCLLRNALANVRPQAPPDEVAAAAGPPERADQHGPGGALAVVRRERGRLNADIMSFCQRQIGDVYGIRFDGVDLVDVRPPEELEEALNGVMSARSEDEALQARVEADCERRVIAARRGVEIARVKASASEREIVGLAAALDELERQGTLDLYLERRRVEVFSQSRLSYVRVGDRAAHAAHDGGRRPSLPHAAGLRRMP